MQSSQHFATKHLGLLPEMPPKSSALQYRFQIARTLARNGHLKLGGDESRAGMVTSPSLCATSSSPNGIRIQSPKASWMQGASTSK
eukprot:2660395-Pleurochrysis_carterae.AAC.1